MGNIFSLDSDIKQVIQDALDDLLANGADGGLGKTCVLVYPPKYVTCENCVSDPISGRSIGRYRHGGPAPFTGGKCPMCQGGGKKAEEVTENITLLCNWQPKQFRQNLMEVNIRVPYGFVETKGYLSDLPKIMKADHIIFQLPVAPFNTQRYKLIGEPGDRSNIIQGRYFVALWERWNG